MRHPQQVSGCLTACAPQTPLLTLPCQPQSSHPGMSACHTGHRTSCSPHAARFTHLSKRNRQTPPHILLSQDAILSTGRAQVAAHRQPGACPWQSPHSGLPALPLPTHKLQCPQTCADVSRPAQMPQVRPAHLSNCTPQTPLRTLPSQRTVLVRRSNILTSPLSYPASTQRSASL